VLQRAGRLRLAKEAVVQLRLAGQGVGHHLDRDGALQDQIEGAVDRPHGPLADELDDLVLADLREVAMRHGRGCCGGSR
jgi:hypothetical protein